MCVHDLYGSAMRPNLFDYFSITHADRDDRAPALSFAVSLRTVDLLTSRLLIVLYCDERVRRAAKSREVRLRTTPKPHENGLLRKSIRTRTLRRAISVHQLLHDYFNLN